MLEFDSNDKQNGEALTISATKDELFFTFNYGKVHM